MTGPVCSVEPWKLSKNHLLKLFPVDLWISHISNLWWHIAWSFSHVPWSHWPAPAAPALGETAVIISQASLTTWCLEWLIIWFIPVLWPFFNYSFTCHGSGPLPWFFPFHLLAIALELPPYFKQFLPNIDIQGNHCHDV